MNVSDLRRAITGLDGEMPVLIATETGPSHSPNLYVVIEPDEMGRDPQRSLLLSEFGPDDGYENLTRSRPLAGPWASWGGDGVGP